MSDISPSARSTSQTASLSSSQDHQLKPSAGQIKPAIIDSQKPLSAQALQVISYTSSAWVITSSVSDHFGRSSADSWYMIKSYPPCLKSLFGPRQTSNDQKLDLPLERDVVQDFHQLKHCQTDFRDPLRFKNTMASHIPIVY
ncbi:hypothetical protein PTTG_27977 [Puccinia triticina 1-1 BBBD Race 1]|uniref:Uncharacterized protein n=2 Tax=Puccinia triticina TaxID=208348 RepID=A0A180GGG1_PUCT1|nr:uncharacterized protein PtA15_3A348 [Puccinia triticina]OAV91402.1 hypothetical protein PTTG_27977 [Puccinia triticina 1-1 BBBD Race 1]WAQ82982.1 hypothetical protein PtA15_3A348 [Puccinia triticina]